MTTERKSLKMKWNESTYALDSELSDGWEVEKLISSHPSYSAANGNYSSTSEGYVLFILVKHLYSPDKNIKI